MVFDTDTVARHFDSYLDFVKSYEPARVYGKVTEVIGILIESTGPSASVGDVCHIEKGGRLVCRAEVVGFRKDRTLLMPLGSIEGIHPGMSVAATGHPLSVQVGDGLWGAYWTGLATRLTRRGRSGRRASAPSFRRSPTP